MAEGNDNFTNEFGKPNVHKQENAEKAKYRGYPKKATNSEGAENYSEGIDPNADHIVYPDGTVKGFAYGKKPSYIQRYSWGSHEMRLQDGTNYKFSSGPSFNVDKSDRVEWGNGHHDSGFHNGERGNFGTEQGGGSYASSGKGGGAQAGATMAFHSDEHANMLAAKDFKITGGGNVTMGAGNNGGQHAQYLTLKKDGGVVMGTKGREGSSGGQAIGAGGGGGGGDIIIRADKGSIKFVSGSGSKEASITLGSGGDITFHGQDFSFSPKKNLNFGPGEGYKWDMKPGMPKSGLPDRITKHEKEKGVHDSEYAAYHGGEASEVT